MIIIFISIMHAYFIHFQRFSSIQMFFPSRNKKKISDFECIGCWFQGRIDYDIPARTDLVVVDNGVMNADSYIRNILKEHVVPFTPYIGENSIFMDDNARSHRARIVLEYLEEVEVSRMEWPTRSPHLNQIDQVWDNLNRRLRSSENNLATLNDLGIQLREIWGGLDQNIFRSLILSMNRRCRAVIKARGVHTKY